MLHRTLKNLYYELSEECSVKFCEAAADIAPLKAEKEKVSARPDGARSRSALTHVLPHAARVQTTVSPLQGWSRSGPRGRSRCTAAGEVNSRTRSSENRPLRHARRKGASGLLHPSIPGPQLGSCSVPVAVPLRMAENSRMFTSPQTGSGRGPLPTGAQMAAELVRSTPYDTRTSRAYSGSEKPVGSVAGRCVR